MREFSYVRKKISIVCMAATMHVILTKCGSSQTTRLNVAWLPLNFLMGRQKNSEISRAHRCEPVITQKIRTTKYRTSKISTTRKLLAGEILEQEKEKHSENYRISDSTNLSLSQT